MNSHAPHPHDVVRVHPGITYGGRNLGGTLLTVFDVHDGLVDLAEWTGAAPVELATEDVDVLTPIGASR